MEEYKIQYWTPQLHMSPKFGHPDHQTQEVLFTWFSLSREERRKFDWESRNAVLYRALIPLFFEDVELHQIVIPHAELNDRFNKFFASSFKMKTVNVEGENLFNLNELFLFTLDQPIEVWEASKKTNTKVQAKNRRQSAINFGNLAKPWQKIEHSSGIIKLMSQSEGQEAKIIYADKNIVSRFRIQILKDDYQIKNNFICEFLFCCTSPSFSLSSVSVQRMKKGYTIKHCDQKIYLIFDGSVIQEIVNKSQQRQKAYKSGLGQKWKFQLVKGSIICKNNMKQILNGAGWTNDDGKSYTHSYILTADSTFLTISYADFSKILKNEKNTQKLILQKIGQSEAAHEDFINRSLNAQLKIRQSQNIPVQIPYSIPRNKKTKAFRKKTHGEQENFDQFITFDRYQKMTQNKQNIEKKHLVYSQLNNLLRQKEKQDRFIKKLNTAKGMKEIKRCEYMARLKQNKIENLAIKDSILNAERYRDRPHEVKFIFEEQMMDKFMKQSTNFPIKRHKKKFISMVQFINDEPTQSRVTKAQRFESEMLVSKQVKPATKFMQTQSNKLMHCESIPNLQLFGHSHHKAKNQGRIGSAFNLQKTQSRNLL